jgi:hypothetical protein
VRIDFTHAGASGSVEIEVAAITDPEALGCPPHARGFPYCRAAIEQDARGYADALGWIQLVDSSETSAGFELDPFEPLGAVGHPFAFFGFAPTLFDAPSRPQRPDMTWTADSFLAGIADERQAVALLGFSWGFKIRGGEISVIAPAELDESAWTSRIPALHEACPDWDFLPGFAAA